MDEELLKNINLDPIQTLDQTQRFTDPTNTVNTTTKQGDPLQDLLDLSDKALKGGVNIPTQQSIIYHPENYPAIRLPYTNQTWTFPFSRPSQSEIDPNKSIDEQVKESQSWVEQGVKIPYRFLAGTLGKVINGAAMIGSHAYALANIPRDLVDNTMNGADNHVLSNIWDRTFHNVVTDFTEGLEKELTNSNIIYPSKSYQEGQWYKALTTTTGLSTDIVDMVAFSAAAVIPGIGVEELGLGVSMAGTRGGRAINKLFSKLGNLIGKGKLAGELGTRAATETAIDIAESGTTNLAKIGANLSDWTVGTYNAGVESLLEGKQQWDQGRDEVAKKLYGKEYKDLTTDQQVIIKDKVALSVGKVIGANFPMLMLSESLMNNMRMRVLDPKRSSWINTIADKLGSKVGKGTWGKVALGTGMAMASEGLWEEGLQNTFQDYFKPTDTNENLNFINQYTKMLTTDDGKRSIALGALMGLVTGGASGIRSRMEERATKSGWKSYVDIANKYFGYNLGTIASTDSNGNIVENQDNINKLTEQSIANKNLLSDYDKAFKDGDTSKMKALETIIAARHAYRFLGDEDGEEMLRNDIQLKKRAIANGELKGLDQLGAQILTDHLDRKADTIEKLATLKRSIDSTLTNDQILDRKKKGKVVDDESKQSEYDEVGRTMFYTGVLNQIYNDRLSSIQEAINTTSDKSMKDSLQEQYNKTVELAKDSKEKFESLSNKSVRDNLIKENRAEEAQAFKTARDVQDEVRNAQIKPLQEQLDTITKEVSELDKLAKTDTTKANERDAKLAEKKVVEDKIQAVKDMKEGSLDEQVAINKLVEQQYIKGTENMFDLSYDEADRINFKTGWIKEFNRTLNNKLRDKADASENIDDAHNDILQGKQVDLNKVITSLENNNTTAIDNTDWSRITELVDNKVTSLGKENESLDTMILQLEQQLDPIQNEMGIELANKPEEVSPVEIINKYQEKLLPINNQIDELQTKRNGNDAEVQQLRSTVNKFKQNYLSDIENNSKMYNPDTREKYFQHAFASTLSQVDGGHDNINKWYSQLSLDNPGQSNNYTYNPANEKEIDSYIKSLERLLKVYGSRIENDLKDNEMFTDKTISRETISNSTKSGDILDIEHNRMDYLSYNKYLLDKAKQVKEGIVKSKEELNKYTEDVLANYTRSQFEGLTEIQTIVPSIGIKLQGYDGKPKPSDIESTTLTNTKLLQEVLDDLRTSDKKGDIVVYLNKLYDQVFNELPLSSITDRQIRIDDVSYFDRNGKWYLQSDGNQVTDSILLSKLNQERANIMKIVYSILYYNPIDGIWTSSTLQRSDIGHKGYSEATSIFSPFITDHNAYNLLTRLKALRDSLDSKDVKVQSDAKTLATESGINPIFLEDTITFIENVIRLNSLVEVRNILNSNLSYSELNKRKNEKIVEDKSNNYVPNSLQDITITQAVHALSSNNPLITLVQAVAGAGKTSAIANNVIKLLNINKDNSIVSARTFDDAERQLQRVKNETGITNAVNVDTLIDEWDTRISDSTDFVIIDEVGLLSSVIKTEQLFSKYYNTNADRIARGIKPVKLLLLYDPHQVSGDIHGSTVTVGQTVGSTKCYKPQTVDKSERVTTGDLSTATKAFQGRRGVVQLTTLNSTDVDNIRGKETKGAQGYKDRSELIDSLTAKIGNSHKSKVIVTNKPDAAQYYREQVGKLVLPADTTIVIVDNPLSVQGTEWNEVYLDIDRGEYGKPQYNSYMTMLTSRAIDYLGLVMDTPQYSNKSETQGAVVEARDIAKNRAEYKRKLDYLLLRSTTTKVKEADDKSKSTVVDIVATVEDKVNQSLDDSEDLQDTTIVSTPTVQQIDQSPVVDNVVNDGWKNPNPIVMNTITKDVQEVKVDDNTIITLTNPQWTGVFKDKQGNDLTTESTDTFGTTTVSESIIPIGKEVILVPRIDDKGVVVIEGYTNVDGKAIKVSQVTNREMATKLNRTFDLQLINKADSIKSDLMKHDEYLVNMDDDNSYNILKGYSLYTGTVSNTRRFNIHYGNTTTISEQDGVDTVIAKLIKLGSDMFDDNRDEKVRDIEFKIFDNNLVKDTELSKAFAHTKIYKGMPYAILTFTNGTKRFVRFNSRYLNESDTKENAETNVKTGEVRDGLLYPLTKIVQPHDNIITSFRDNMNDIIADAFRIGNLEYGNPMSIYLKAITSKFEPITTNGKQSGVKLKDGQEITINDLLSPIFGLLQQNKKENFDWSHNNLQPNQVKQIQQLWTDYTKNQWRIPKGYDFNMDNSIDKINTLYNSIVELMSDETKRSNVEKALRDNTTQLVSRFFGVEEKPVYVKDTQVESALKSLGKITDGNYTISQREGMLGTTLSNLQKDQYKHYNNPIKDTDEFEELAKQVYVKFDQMDTELFLTELPDTTNKKGDQPIEIKFEYWWNSKVRDAVESVFKEHSNDLYDRYVDMNKVLSKRKSKDKDINAQQVVQKMLYYSYARALQSNGIVVTPNGQSDVSYQWIPKGENLANNKEKYFRNLVEIKHIKDPKEQSGSRDEYRVLTHQAFDQRKGVISKTFGLLGTSNKTIGSQNVKMIREEMIGGRVVKRVTMKSLLDTTNSYVSYFNALQNVILSKPNLRELFNVRTKDKYNNNVEYVFDFPLIKSMDEIQLNHYLTAIENTLRDNGVTQTELDKLRKENVSTTLTMDNVKNILNMTDKLYKPLNSANFNKSPKINVVNGIPVIGEEARKYVGLITSNINSNVDNVHTTQIQIQSTTNVVSKPETTSTVTTQSSETSNPMGQEEVKPSGKKRSFKKPSINNNTTYELRTSQVTPDFLGERMDKPAIIRLVKSLLPDIKGTELQFVTGLVDDEFKDGNLYGTFENGIIKLRNYISNNGIDGSMENIARHEVFHKIWWQYLTNRQRNAISDDFKSYYKETEGKEFVGDVKDIQEAVARIYQTYRTSNSTLKPGLFNDFVQWFKRVFSFMFNNEQRLHTLFDHINRGKFKQRNVENESLDVRDNMYEIKDIFQTTNTYHQLKGAFLSTFNEFRKDGMVTDDGAMYPLNPELSLAQTKDALIEAYNNDPVISDILGSKHIIRDRFGRSIQKTGIDYLSDLLFRTIMIDETTDLNDNNDLSNIEQLNKEIIDDELGTAPDEVNLNDEIDSKEKRSPEISVSARVKDMLNGIVASEKDGKVTYANPIRMFVRALKLMSNIQSLDNKFIEQLKRNAERYDASHEAKSLIKIIESKYNNSITNTYTKKVDGKAKSFTLPNNLRFLRDKDKGDVLVISKDGSSVHETNNHTLLQWYLLPMNEGKYTLLYKGKNEDHFDYIDRVVEASNNDHEIIYHLYKKNQDGEDIRTLYSKIASHNQANFEVVEKIVTYGKQIEARYIIGRTGGGYQRLRSLVEMGLKEEIEQQGDTHEESVARVKKLLERYDRDIANSKNNVQLIRKWGELFNLTAYIPVEKFTGNQIDKLAEDIRNFMTNSNTYSQTLRSYGNEYTPDVESQEEGSLQTRVMDMNYILEKQGALVGRIATLLNEYNKSLRVDSITNSKGDRIYTFQQSTFIKDSIQRFNDGLLVDRSILPEYYSSSAYKDGIYLSDGDKSIFDKSDVNIIPLGKIYKSVSYAGTKITYPGLFSRGVDYTHGQINDHLHREFNAGFIDRVISTKERYYQDMYNEAHRPNPEMVEVKLLNGNRGVGTENELHLGIRAIIKQMVNRPDLSKSIQKYKKGSTSNFSVLQEVMDEFYNKRNLESVPLSVEEYNNKEFMNTLVNHVYNKISEKANDLTREAIENEFEFKTLIPAGLWNHIDWTYWKEQLGDQLKRTSDNDREQVVYKIKDPQRFGDDKLHYVDSSEERQQLFNTYAPLVHLWYLNSYIQSYSLNNLFTGDQAYYLDGKTILKRLQIPSSAITRGFVNDKIGMPSKFNVAFGTDIPVGVEYEKSIWNDLKSKVQDGTTLDSLMEQNKSELSNIVSTLYHLLDGDVDMIDKVLSTYPKDYKFTDGQAIATPLFYNKLERGFGQDYGIGAIIKPVHFAIDKNGVPENLKCSIFVLSDDMIYKKDGVTVRYPKLKELRDKMENHVNEAGEHTPIDIYAFETTTKIAVPTPAFETDSSDMLMGGEIKKQSVKQYDSTGFGMSFNPKHEVEDSDTALPSQLQYMMNILEGNDEAASYIYQRTADLINHKLGEFKDKLYTNGVLDKGKFVEAMKKATAGQGNERLYELLTAIADQTDRPWDVPVLSDKMITALASNINRNITKIRLPGSKLILQSVYGTNLVEKQVDPKTGKVHTKVRTKLDDPEMNKVASNLKYSKTAKGLFGKDDKGRLYAEAIIPRGLLPKDVEADIEANLRNRKQWFTNGDILGFRIPSSELHSAVPLRIVGFYDNANSNAIIVADQIVALHGSDYDVDSLFVITRSKSDMTDEQVTELDALRKGKVNPTVIARKEFEYTHPGYKWNETTGSYIFDHIYDSNLRPEQKEGYYNNAILEKMLEVISAAKNTWRMTRTINMDELESEEVRLLRVQNPELYEWVTMNYPENKVEDEFKKLAKINLDLSKPDDRYKAHFLINSGRSGVGITANGMKTLAYMVKGAKDESGKVSNTYIKGDVNVNFNNTKYNQFTQYIGENDIWYSFDALLQAGVDNPKVQILATFNLTNETLPQYIAMTGLGIDKEIRNNFMIQPILKELTRRSGGYEKVMGQLKKALAKRIGDLTHTDPTLISEQLNIPVSIDNSLLAKYLHNEHVDPVTKRIAIDRTTDVSFLAHQYNVLTMYQELKKVGKAITTVSQVLSLVRGTPVQIDRMDDLYEKLDEVFDKKFPLNVDNLQNSLPHFKAVIDMFRWFRNDLINAEFTKHGYVLRDLVDKLNKDIQVVDEEGNTSTEEGMNMKLDFRKHRNSALLRDEVMRYFLSTLYNLDNHEYQYGLNRYIGKEGMVMEFGNKLIALNRWLHDKGNLEAAQNMGYKDFFMQHLSSRYNKRSGAIDIMFTGGSDISPEDLQDAQDAFSTLNMFKIDTTIETKGDLKFTKYHVSLRNIEEVVSQPKYNEFQLDFLHYANLVYGNKIGGNSFSVALPSDIFTHKEDGRSYIDRVNEVIQNLRSKIVTEQPNGTKVTSNPYLWLLPELKDELATGNNSGVPTAPFFKSIQEGNKRSYLGRSGQGYEREVTKASDTSKEGVINYYYDLHYDNRIGAYNEIEFPNIIKAAARRHSKTDYDKDIVYKYVGTINGIVMYQIVGESKRNKIYTPSTNFINSEELDKGRYLATYKHVRTDLRKADSGIVKLRALHNTNGTFEDNTGLEVGTEVKVRDYTDTFRLNERLGKIIGINDDGTYTVKLERPVVKSIVSKTGEWMYSTPIGEQSGEQLKSTQEFREQLQENLEDGDTKRLISEGKLGKIVEYLRTLTSEQRAMFRKLRDAGLFNIDCK